MTPQWHTPWRFHTHDWSVRNWQKSFHQHPKNLALFIKAWPLTLSRLEVASKKSRRIWTLDPDFRSLFLISVIWNLFSRTIMDKSSSQKSSGVFVKSLFLWARFYWLLMLDCKKNVSHFRLLEASIGCRVFFWISRYFFNFPNIWA